MDEVFGCSNFVSAVTFQKTGGQNPGSIANIYDTLLWYAKNIDQVKFVTVFSAHPAPDSSDPNYVHIELPDGSCRPMTSAERKRHIPLPDEAKIFRYAPITSAGSLSEPREFEWHGVKYCAPANSHWKTHLNGMKQLALLRRLLPSGRGLAYKMYWNDFCAERLSNIWTDTQSGGFNDPQVYVVQTTTKVIQRCILMTTDPGDLVLDPTCGSGTTAYVAEQWGRRWITIDISRVPLALARQRLLTATFPYYQLKDESRGPAGGFVYVRKQNKKGEEIGGTVPHVTLSGFAGVASSHAGQGYDPHPPLRGFPLPPGEGDGRRNPFFPLPAGEGARVREEWLKQERRHPAATSRLPSRFSTRRSTSRPSTG